MKKELPWSLFFSKHAKTEASSQEAQENFPECEISLDFSGKSPYISKTISVLIDSNFSSRASGAEWRIPWRWP
jgi:hypothetical protein